MIISMRCAQPSLRFKSIILVDMMAKYYNIWSWNGELCTFWKQGIGNLSTCFVSTLLTCRTLFHRCPPQYIYMLYVSPNLACLMQSISFILSCLNFSNPTCNLSSIIVIVYHRIVSSQLAYRFTVGLRLVAMPRLPWRLGGVGDPEIMSTSYIRK